MSEENLTEEQRAAKAAEAAQAHRDKFAAGADGAPPDPADAPVKPEHVPEKFWDSKTGKVNYEAWNKAHTELELRFHKGPELGPDGKPVEKPADEKDPPKGADPNDPPKAVLETPAATKAAENYAQNGELSAEDYTALEAEGISRDMVDSYIAGKEARASALRSAAFEPAGGEEQYGEMLVWAKDNLDEPSIKAFNRQVTSGDPDVIRSAVTALAAEYGKTATVEGERTGGSPPAVNSTTFNSRREMTAAINKLGEDGRRLYDVDPAYRMEVTRKIGNSRKKGTVSF